MNDKDGVPVEKEPKPAQNLSEFDCKKCGKKLILRQGTSKAGKPYSFFGCSGFPKCKTNYDEVGGVPKYE
ncbi:topoisomerase DNA-binding C4 zinc finger domain-containing protein [Moraxella bovis]|nr:topoisomerase DNA-binding C4 zinc finger domain-containing protein [Moraxella bovis]